MHTVTTITIRARVETIYALAAAVERWPDLLPHYRWVRKLGPTEGGRLMEMAARRDIIPVRWAAEQRCDPDVPRITFRHMAGITRGMDVEWSFAPTPDGTRVSISHALRLGWPLIGELVADRVIGRFFIANIAGKTLRRIKQLAEAADAGTPPVPRRAGLRAEAADRDTRW